MKGFLKESLSDILVKLGFTTTVFLVFFIGLMSTEDALGIEYPSYEMECYLDIARHALRVKQKTTFINNTQNEIGEVYFHIYPHRRYTPGEKDFLLRYAAYFKIEPYPEGFKTGDLKIETVRSNEPSINLDYLIEGNDQTILKVILPEKLKSHQSTVLEIDFKLDIPHAFGRFGWHKDIISLCRWYPILSVLDNKGWHNYPFYPYHQPFFSEAAHYKVKITLPKNYEVAHTGSLKEKGINSDTTQTLRFETEMPVRDFSLVASSQYKIYSLKCDDIEINSFYLKGDDFYGKTAAEFACDLIRFYNKNFGRYPYREFNIAPVYLGYGGEETSNLILIDTRAYRLPHFLIRYFDFLISHETGHQWWYNLVGSDEFKETWLDEGINSWCLLQYLEDKYGKKMSVQGKSQDARVMVLPKGLDWFIPNFTFNQSGTTRYLYIAKNGLEQPILNEISSFLEPSFIFSLTYGKGRAVVSMLESLLGREVFTRLMKRYFEDFKFRNASIEDFIKIVQDESGQDLTWFFKQWLATAKICDYAVGKVDDKRIILKRRGGVTMPVKTKIVFSDGKVFEDYWGVGTQNKPLPLDEGGEGKREISLENRPKVKSIQIDPDNYLLEIDKVNNRYPRHFNIKPVPLYFFAYEIPLFLPEDSYSFVVGPDFSSSGLGVRGSLERPYDSLFSLASNYDFNGGVVSSTLGYEMKHLFSRPVNLGFELFDKEDLDGKKEDLSGGKVYLRRELWPASYGLTQVNDHISFYLVRNREFESTRSSQALEEIENINYRKKDEAILGLTLTLDRSGTYPDPQTGYKTGLTLENAMHALGGRESFFRGMVDYSQYLSLKPGEDDSASRASFLKELSYRYPNIFNSQQRFVYHLKIGLGTPSDKNLFFLGGDEGLRGYDRKEIKGANAILGNFEYRFPIVEDLKLCFLDNLIGLSKVKGVLFFDLGKPWYADFSASDFKKDSGFGLRMQLELGSFLERIILRFDVAKAINEPKEEAHFWFGAGHMF